jgi:hypothetical protein
MTKMSTQPLTARAKHPLSKNAFLVLTLGVFLLFSCNKKLAADKMPTTRLEFGHGGGFTGAVTTYYLLDNGRIYEDMTDKTAYKRVNSVGKDEAASLFSDCQKLATLKTDAPGNMYYFVTMKNGDAIPKRWIFGDPATATPQELETFYKRLIGFVPSKKP